MNYYKNYLKIFINSSYKKAIKLMMEALLIGNGNKEEMIVKNLLCVII